MESHPPEKSLHQDVLMFDPETISNSSEIHRIILTKTGDAWIDIEYIPIHLQTYSTEHFDELFDLKPLNYGKTLIHQKQVTSHRYHQSYLRTPKCYIDKVPTSYMFSGFNDTNNQQPLPDLFQPFYHYMVESKDNHFNQVVANWYNNGNDYIAQHSDCEIGMIPNAVISIMNFNRSNDKENCRILKIKPKIDYVNESLHPEIHLLLRHGIMITMGGKFQHQFKHGVPKTDVASVPRFSLSFRQFETNDEESESKEAKMDELNQIPLPFLDTLI